MSLQLAFKIDYKSCKTHKAALSFCTVLPFTLDDSWQTQTTFRNSKATKTAEGAAKVLKNYSKAYILQNLEFEIDFIMIFNIFITQNWSFYTNKSNH